MAKLDCGLEVKVLFERRDKREVLAIEGSEITVKAALMTLLLEVANAGDMSLIDLLHEFVEVAKIKEQYDELDEVMQYLEMEKE